METLSRPRQSGGGRRFVLATLVLVIAILVTSGTACLQSSPAPSSATPAGSPPATSSASRTNTNVDSGSSDYPAASDLLGRMLNAYRTASSYQDEATIELSYHDGTRVVRDAAEISVVFARPNRLRLHAYQARVVADGTTWHAQVNDAGTGNLDGQVLEGPCPDPLTLHELYFDPLLYDQMGSAVLSDDAGRQPLQLELLLASQEPRLLAGDDLDARVLDVESVDGHDCYHLQWKSPRGVHQLWIDMEQFVMRRLAYPRGSLVEPLAGASELRDVTLTANFKNATLRARPNDDVFRWTTPENSRLVRFFVRPPQPLPSTLFGRTVEPFSLQSLDGAELSSATFSGKTTVLVFFHDHPACESTLKQLAAVREKRRASELTVAYLAVCTEPSSRGNDQVREIAQRWQVDVPLARDLKAIGRDLLKLDGAPALVVLGADGRVQLVEIGANPQLERDLAAILDRLAQGADLATEVLAESTAERRRYEQDLAIAQGQLDPLSESISTPLLPAAPFKNFRATRVTDSLDADVLKQWLDKASSPANTWRLADGGDPARLEVDDQGRIAIRTADGQVLETKSVADWSIRRIATSDFGAPTERTLGAIGVSSRGLVAFVALNAKFERQWHYPMPRGATPKSCVPIQPGSLFADNRPYWAVAAADGTVHLLSADGESHDFLAVGAPIIGLALARHENRSLLIIATETSTDVWELDSMP